MRSWVLSFMRLLCLLPGCALAFSQTVTGQTSAGRIRLLPMPEPQAERQAGALPPAHAQELTQTFLSLNLCVDGSPTYPCPSPVTDDGTYIPAITLTYGQILDGVVAYGAIDAAAPTYGTITIFKTDAVTDITTAVCTLRIGIDLACPPASTIFDVGNYTLSATLTFPPGSPYLGFNTSVGPCTTTPTCDVAISIAEDPTSIALNSSANPAALGTSVIFTALVKGSYPAIPTGEALFTVDGTAAPAVPLDSTGAATLTASPLALGTHTITAAYAGANDFLPAKDESLKQQIVPPATATTIASSVNPSAIGESVTFTAKVSAPAGLGVTPMGPVTFKDGTTSIATVSLTAKGTQNTAQTSTSALAPGTHSITAIYAGDAATSASVSPPLIQQVNHPLTMAPPGYRITVTPAAVTLFAGAAAMLTVTVTPVSGFSAAVALNCSNLPNEAACTFSNATIPAGGGTTTLTLTTMFPHDCGSDVPYGGFGALHAPPPGSGTPFRCGSALAGALLLLLRRRHGRMRRLIAIAAVCAIASLSGCGSRCTDFGTTPGSYTFKVNGTAQAAAPVTAGGTPGSSGTSAPDVSVSVALLVKP